MTITIPNPSIFANRKAPVVPAEPKVRTVAVTPVDLTEALVVRPGLVEVVENSHDGVVKAKNLLPGQRVTPWVRNKRTDEWEAMGSERIVAAVDKINGGADVHIHWASLHTDEIKPASYRFFAPALVGTPVVTRTAGFVAVR